MPLLSTRGAATAKAFSSAQQTNWLAELILHFSGDFGRGIAVNPNNQNVIVVGAANNTLTSGYSAGQVSLTSSNGINVYKKVVGASGVAFNVYFFGVDIDQNNFSYVVGLTNVYGNDYIYATRFTSDLFSVTYRTAVGLPGTYSATGRGVAAEAGGNIYIAGFLQNTSTTNTQTVLLKLNVNGTVQWQKTLTGGPINYEIFYGVALDSSNNVYAVGVTYQTVSTTNGLVAKYNSSGVLQWQRSFSSTSSVFIYCVKVDSSGNIYVGGLVGVGGTPAAYLAKLDSSGAILWQRTLGGSGVTSTFESIAIDNIGNIYVAGETNVASGTSGYDYLIAKYNSSGVIQWQRRMAGSTFVTNDNAHSIDVDTNGNYYPLGTMYRFNFVSNTYNDDTVFAKLPNDGSLTGTYSLASTPLIYASTSMTETAGAISSSIISLTDLNSTLTESTASAVLLYNSVQTFYSTNIP